MTKIIYLEDTLKLFEIENYLNEDEIMFLASKGVLKECMKDESVRYLVINESITGDII